MDADADAAGRPLDPWDGFLVGPENALAHAGALALARGKVAGITPLVVFGPTGVGKSRLLVGLAAEHRARRPGATVAVVAAEEFAAACAEGSAQPEGWAAVRGRFRELDLLILDDLPTLERTPWVWEELAHTLDALDERGSAVALASRVEPGAWGRLGWPRRLVSRLGAGLTVAISPPGIESRRRYLMDGLRRHRAVANPDTVERFAAAADGYRTLDGWLARLDLLRQVEPRVAEPDLTERVLATEAAGAEATGSGAVPAATRLDLPTVARSVAEALGVRLGDLRSESRHASIATARHLAIHLARRHTTASVRIIGTYFGDRDPATVRHADRVARQRLAADPALAALVASLARTWPDNRPSS